jgi:predicted nucleic acid-binding protein
MSLPFAFWDTSALIPLCVRQRQSSQANLLYSAYGIAVWWATPVEMISGLTRLERMMEIRHDHFLAGKQRAQELADIWDSVCPSRAIAAQACSLLEQHPLSAADALQLAAALEYFAHIVDGSVFITADQRLANAARQTGFTIEFL